MKFKNREGFGMGSFAWAAAEEYEIDSEQWVVVSRLGAVRFYGPLRGSGPLLFLRQAGVAG